MMYYYLTLNVALFPISVHHVPRGLGVKENIMKDDHDIGEGQKMQVMRHKISKNFSYQIKFFTHSKTHPKNGHFVMHDYNAPNGPELIR